MNEHTAKNPVGWFEIYVQDIERAKAFYRSVFATEFTRLENPGQPPGMELWAFPMHENAIGVTGALAKMPGVASGGNSVIVYFGRQRPSSDTARAGSGSCDLRNALLQPLLVQAQQV
jgi:predicted enzyme related to lactoylglutathione lyase